MVFRAI
jgi:hypothetical protein